MKMFRVCAGGWSDSCEYIFLHSNDLYTKDVFEKNLSEALEIAINKLLMLDISEYKSITFGRLMDITSNTLVEDFGYTLPEYETTLFFNEDSMFAIKDYESNNFLTLLKNIDNADDLVQKVIAYNLSVDKAFDNKFRI